MKPDASLCYHCGLPNPAKPYRVTIASVERSMCCQGCAAVAQLIAGSGFEAIYKQRTAYQPNQNKAANEQGFVWYKEQGAEAKYTRKTGVNTRECELLIEGLSCGACVWLCEQSLQRLNGVEQLSISFESSRLQLKYNHNTKLATIVEHITALGYSLKPYGAQSQAKYFAQKQQQLLMRIGVSGLSMMLVVALSLSLYFGYGSTRYSDFPPAVGSFMLLSNLFISGVAIAYCAWPFFKGAVSAIRQKIVSMDLTISLALLGAYSISSWSVISAFLLQGQAVYGLHETYFESLIMLVFFILISRYIELSAAAKNASQLQALQSVQPLNVNYISDINDAQPTSVPLDTLKTGDLLHIAIGETIPVDGVIVKGHSELDESLLNGEFLPVQRGVGAQVYAGSVNQLQTLIVRASHVGHGTRLSAIQKLAGDLQSAKPQWQSLADKTAHVFLLGVIITAILAACAWWFIDASRMFSVLLAVLIAACPCALSIATPAAITRAVLNLRQQGIVVRNSDALQTLAAIKHIVFDKTGTLTQVKPNITDIQLKADITETKALAIAAALQQNSIHPVANAFKHIKVLHTANAIQTFAGKGIQADYQGTQYRIGSLGFIQQWHPQCELPSHKPLDLWLVLARKSHVLACFCLQESPRPQWQTLANFIHKQQFGLSILSGDKQSRLDALQNSLSLNHHAVYGDLSADQKAQFVNQQQQQGQQVLMVGDGINDSPAMAAASCSVAMPIAPDLAKDQADIVLLKADLSKIERLFKLSSQLDTLIKQGFAWSLAYNLLAIILAVSGLLSPLLAVIGMSLSSAIVVFNSKRIPLSTPKPVYAGDLGHAEVAAA